MPAPAPVLTSSHAAWTWLAARRGRGWAALGAALPDLPALAMTVAARRRGLRGTALWRDVYHRPARDRVHKALHSVLAPIAVEVVTRGRAGALASGWLGHVAVDLVTHRDDAWPHLWPCTERRVRSPLSYWQPDAHGTAFAAGDAGLLAIAALWSPSRAGRFALAGAAALAAAPLLEVLRPDPWRDRRRACEARAGATTGPDPAARPLR